MGQRSNSTIDRVVMTYARIASSITLFGVLLSVVGYYFSNMGYAFHTPNAFTKLLLDILYYLLLAGTFNLPLLLVVGFYLLVYKYYQLGIICIGSCLLFYFLTLRVLADSFV